jgi:hypothetical protein
LLVEKRGCAKCAKLPDIDNTSRKAPSEVTEEASFFFWWRGTPRFKFGELRLTFLSACGTALTHTLHGHLLIGTL